MKNLEASWLSFMTFVIGIAIGTIWTDIPFVTFDESFDLSDITSIILTAFIALFYTNWIQRKFEGTKSNKQFILGEFWELCTKIDLVSSKIMVCVKKPITAEQMREIMEIKSNISNDIISLKTLLRKNFWLLTDSIYERVRKKYIDFNYCIDFHPGKVMTEEEFKEFTISKGQFIREIRFIKSEINLM